MAEESDYIFNCKRTYKILTGTAIIIASGAVIFIGLGAYSLNASIDRITWNTIRNSSIVITQDDDQVNYHLVQMYNNKYLDILNEYIIKKESVITVKDSAPYFVNIDQVKEYYSKDELMNIMKQFKLNDEYVTSSDKVKIKK